MSQSVTQEIISNVLTSCKSKWRWWEGVDGEAWGVIDMVAQALREGLDEVEVWSPDCSCDSTWITFSSVEADIYRIGFDELPEGLKGQVNQLLQAMIAEGIPVTDEELRLWWSRWFWKRDDDSDEE